MTLAHQAKMAADPEFAVNWATAKDWSEEGRYNVYTQAQARDLLQAITDEQSGIMAWLQIYW